MDEGYLKEDDQPIRVLLCDDHDGIRTLVRDLLTAEPGITVVSETADIPTLLAALPLTKPDIVLLDCMLHGRSSLEAIGAARTLSPESRILMFSAENDPAYCRRAMNLGAHGYLLKESADQLGAALRAVDGGGTYIDTTL